MAHSSRVHELVGREEVLQAFGWFAADVAAGRPACLVLTGPPGMGKTACWRRGVEVLTEAGRVLSARPDEVSRSISYTTLTGLFDPDRTGTRRPKKARRGGAASSDMTSWIAAASERMGSRQPVVLAIDDAHWVDPASARVLRHVLRWAPGQGVGAVVTTRSNAPPDWLVGAFGADPRVMPLAPLDGDQVDAMIRTRLGVSLRRTTLRAIVEGSGGNPYFALELARAALAGGGAPLGPRPLPLSLSRLVADRVRSAFASCGEVLVVAAASVAPTPLEVAAIVGPKAWPALQHGIDLGLLEVDSGRLRFTHPLLAAAALDAASPVQRRRIFARLAASTTDPEAAAWQWSETTDLPDALTAERIELGARAALASGASESASILARRAADLTPSNDVTGQRARRLLAVDAAWVSGDTDLPTRELPVLLGQEEPGNERAQILRRMASIEAHTGTWGRCLAIVHDALEESSTDHDLTAALLAYQAFALMQSGDVRRAYRPLMVAIRAARDGAESASDVESMVLLFEVIRAEVRGSDLVTRLDALGQQESLDVWFPTGSRMVLVGTMCKWVDRFDDAHRILQSAYRYRWDRAEERLLVPILFQLTELEVWAGRFDVAAHLVEVAEGVARRSGVGPTARAMHLISAGLLAARTGRLQDAQAMAGDALALARRVEDGRQQLRALGVLGQAQLAGRQFSPAVDHLLRAEELRHELGYVHPGVIRVSADLVEALLGLGDLDRAAEVASVFATESDRAATPWARSCALRVRGLVAGAQGQRPLAVQLLREATEVGDQPDPFEAARSSVLLAEALRHDRRQVEARHILEEAHVIYRRLGAVGRMHDVQIRLEDLGHRGPKGELTAAQSAIARLVAQGRTNKEIAAELFISPKTVEAHLSSVYQRLGLRSRTELAAFEHRRAEGISPMPSGSGAGLALGEEENRKLR